MKMEKKKYKWPECSQFRVAGDNYSDWYTIRIISENKYEVARQGQGDYETYEGSRQHVDFLLSLAQ